MKVSLLFYPNTKRTDMKTREIPLYSRFIVQREKAELCLHISITKEQLENWDSNTMRISEKDCTVNSLLNRIDAKFQDFKAQNMFKLAEYSAKDVRDAVMGLQRKPIELVISFIDNYYKSTIEANPGITVGTKRNYKKTINHFYKFLKFKEMGSPSFTDITVAFALEFKDYLLAHYPKIEKKPLTEPSAFDLIKKLRTIFERAFDQQLIGINPFKKVKLKSRSPKRPWLDIYHVKKIAEMDAFTHPTQGLYKNLFLFCIYTGLSYSDVVNLTPDNVVFRQDGCVKLSIQRRKTAIVTEMFLPQSAVEIINLYRNTPKAKITGKILPIRSNKEINAQLKIIAGICNIPIPLTVHVARHSFRQMLSESGIVETAVIKVMMGHSSRNDIDDIYYSVTESRLLEAKKMLELYLKNNLI
ncbi:MAG: site-specific integrase [Bacteroidota bacterium]